MQLCLDIFFRYLLKITDIIFQEKGFQVVQKQWEQKRRRIFPLFHPYLTIKKYRTFFSFSNWYTVSYISIHVVLSIGECPSNSPFLNNNGAEGPRPIVFKEWRDTRTFSNLKSTHCILLIINLVTKKAVYSI